MDSRITIRRVTTLDKEMVLAMRNNAEYFPDTLPALYDHYASIPDAYLAGLFYDEKLAGFLVGHIGLMRTLFHHVIQWAILSVGVNSVLTLSGEVPATGERPRRFDRTVFTWRWTELTISPRKLLREEDEEAPELEPVSDESLSMIFNDKKTRDYIAPKGMMLLYWTPLKPLSENIPTIRGVEGSTNIYSDIKPGPDGGTSTGLLTCCTKYKATLGGSEMGFKFCLDIFGTDLSSVRKHLIRHLNDIQRTSENTVGLETYLPEGMEWSDVILIFIELGIDLKDADIENTYALEWWRKSMF